MTAASLFQVDDAAAAIRRCGFFSMEHAEIGARVRQFADDGFPTKTPHGLEFLAQNSAGREVQTTFPFIYIYHYLTLSRIFRRPADLFWLCLVGV